MEASGIGTSFSAAAGAEQAAIDLYHSALEVRVAAARFVIEMTPVRDARGEQRGVVAEGPVRTRWAGRLRILRYEIRRWRDGHIPDIDEAVGSPRRLTDERARARRVLDLVPQVPTPVWGRDDLKTGDMWELELGHRLADCAQRDRHRIDPASARRTRAGMAGRARGCAAAENGDAARALFRCADRGLVCMHGQVVAGRCLLDVGEPEPASRLTTQEINGYEPWRVGSRCFLQADLAAAHLVGRGVGHAAALGHDAVRTSARVDSARAHDRLRVLRRQVRALRTGSPQLGESDDRIKDLLARDRAQREDPGP